MGKDDHNLIFRFIIKNKEFIKMNIILLFQKVLWLIIWKIIQYQMLLLKILL